MLFSAVYSRRLQKITDKIARDDYAKINAAVAIANVSAGVLNALEAKLRSGGTVTLQDLQGTRARVSAGGPA